MTMYIISQPRYHFDDANGNPAVGYRVFTYLPGSTTKATTYTDSTGVTPNTNPIVLNARGEATLWANQGSAFKIVLAPPGSDDPPISPITTDDNVPVETGLSNRVISAQTGITFGGYFSFAHNFNALPTAACAMMVNTIADFGYSPGSCVPLVQNYMRGDNSTSEGINILSTTTTTTVSFDVNGIRVLNYINNQFNIVNASNWNVIVSVWR